MEHTGRKTAQGSFKEEGDVLSTPKRANATNVSEETRNKRVVAYPVHAQKAFPGAEHWTLAVMVNENWVEGAEHQTNQRWQIFHFDTLHCNANSKINAVKTALFIAESSDDSEIDFCEVAVPYQPAGSNDCGLYPAHFLKIFLSNIDKSISICKSGDSGQRVRGAFFLISTLKLVWTGIG